MMIKQLQIAPTSVDQRLNLGASVANFLIMDCFY